MNMKNALTDSRVIEATPEMLGTRSGPSIADTAGASLSYKYAPLMNRATEKSRFHNVVEEGFVASDNIPEDLMQYGTSMVRAKSQAQMDFIASSLRKGQGTRETLSRSGFVTSMAVEVFDPVNWIALPFASVNRLRSVGSAASRTGAGTAAIVGAQEAIRAPLDALGTTSETAMNIGSAFLIGSAIGGVARVPAARRIKAQKSAEQEIQKLREAIEPIDGVEFDANIADSMFTNSWLYKGVTTPMKRTLQNPDIPNEVKLTMLEIANDAGILLAGNKVGQALKNSVFQNAKLREAEWVGTNDDLTRIWGESHSKGVTQVMDRMYGRAEYEDWLTSVDRKAMSGEKAANDYEAQAMERLNAFYGSWEKRLNDQGMFGNKGFFLKDVARRETIVTDLQAQLDGVGVGSTTTNRRKIQSIIDRNKAKIADRKAAIADMDESGPTLPSNEEVFRPRYWDKTYISNNREALEDILFDWFSANPTAYNKRADGQYGKTELSTRPEDVRGRAVFAVDSILGLKDVTDFDVASFGHGKSKHMKHRGIDIPNKLVLDFIHNNPIAVMKAYTARTSPKYEFAKQFENKNIDDVLDEKVIQMVKSGMKEDDINAVLKDIRHMHDRVAGTVLREPDAMNQTTARLMRSAAQLNYLGSAGISTITEPAKIMMEHGIGKSMRGLLGVLKDEQLKLGAKEARMAGEALEMLMGNAHLRLVEDMGNNPLRADFLDKATDAFFTLNGLGPITRLFKDFDGMMRSHTLIDYSVRLTQGKASKMETEYLARYGVDVEMAKKIAAAPHQKSQTGFYLANTEAWTDTIEFPATTADVVTGPTKSFDGDRYKPAFYRKSDNTIYIDEDYIRDVMWADRGWENPRVEGVTPIEKGIINSPNDYVTFIKMHEIMHTIHSAKSLGFDKRTKVGKAGYENAINDLATAEIKKQARVSPDTVKSFRNALSSGIANTILMGTPADKPIITDGVVYIPMRVASKFGMKEDAKFTGYARIENGLLGLPFQFYSYALAATNKTTAAMAHGQLKNQYLGTAIAMGLGYMTLQLKTPNYIEMEYSDQFARSFDYSGVAAIYSDLFYTAMSTSLALGGPNITGDVLAPRYPQKPDAIDAATGLLGAGPSITADLTRGAWDMVSGDVGGGSKDFIRSLPYMRLWFLKGFVNNMTNAMETELDGPSGFKRY